MKKIIFLFCLFTHIHSVFSQNESTNSGFNFGFEKLNNNGKLPDKWFKWGTEDYTLKIDTAVKHNGNVSVSIESAENTSKKSFGCVAMAIPANYLGKEIELRAYMKFQNVSDGSIGLLMRIDDKDQRILELEDGHQKNIHGSGPWGFYSVSLALPAKAKIIYIGASLTGTGKLWVDDFQVLIDGKKIGDAKQKAKIELKADRDTEFDSASGIASIPLDSQKIQTLIVLGKVWGFLKYYHPEVAKGNYNWDYELFRILPKVINIKDEKERNAILSSWITDLGILSKAKKIKIDSSEVKLYPDLKWIDDSSMGTILSEQLRIIKNAKRPDEHYYVDLSKKIGDPEFKEKIYSRLHYPDAGFQLLSLYRYWNIIQYYYPYKNLFDESWDHALLDFIPKFVNATNELEYKKAVLLLIGRIKDANANIMAPNPIISTLKGNNKPVVDLSIIENKAVVTRIAESSIVESTNLQAGDIILKINDKSIVDIINEKKEYIPSSNSHTLLRNVAMDLLRTNDSLISITYQRETEIKSTVVKCYSRDFLYKLKNRQKKDTCFKYPAPDVVYIYTGTIKNKYLEKAMPNFLKANGIIVDLRGVPSESIVSTFSKYILPAPVSFVKYTNGSMMLPGLFTFVDKQWVGLKNKKYYKGKVVMLVNETTQGFAEYHAMAFRMAPNATLVGSATAGANGNLSEVYLPGGIRTMISGIGIYYPDGRETQRVGLVPDVVVYPTIKGITEHRDELLEKAVEVIKNR
ncbi:MAG: S41 family peptidase [Bacteroidota bacterium]